jgi:hypothetical protein
MKDKENTKYFTGIRATKLPPPFPAYYGEEKYIFVSYAHKDSEIVFPALEKLNNNGIRLWYDEGLQAGEDWFDFMKDKITQSAGFLVFLSEKSVASPHANEEIEFAHNIKKKVVGVQIGEFKLSANLEAIFSNNPVINLQLDGELDHTSLFETVNNLIDI